MNPHEQKARSRGVSRDMSPEAISKRFDILVELEELARVLSSAEPLRNRGTSSGHPAMERRNRLGDIGRAHGVVVFYLFGSRAADGLRLLDGLACRDGRGSDLDVGVVLRDPFEDPMLGYGGLHADLTELFAPLRVDLVLLDEADAFVREAAVRGKEVYCGDEQKRDLWELDALRRAGDLLPIQRRLERELYGTTNR